MWQRQLDRMREFEAKRRRIFNQLTEFIEELSRFRVMVHEWRFSVRPVRKSKKSIRFTQVTFSKICKKVNRGASLISRQTFFRWHKKLTKEEGFPWEWNDWPDDYRFLVCTHMTEHFLVDKNKKAIGQRVLHGLKKEMKARHMEAYIKSTYVFLRAASQVINAPAGLPQIELSDATLDLLFPGWKPELEPSGLDFRSEVAHMTQRTQLESPSVSNKTRHADEY